MITEFPSTSIGKKMIMAVTGIMLLGFVIGHLAGNLLIFLGPDALNAYGQKLKDMLPLLWVARVVLLGALGAHILVAILLVKQNRDARPIPYAMKSSVQTTYAARTMAVSGVIILAFVIYHLLHFTFRVTHPDLSHLTDANGYHDIYTMVVASFQDPLVSSSYIVAIALLSLHLSHGFKSLFQTLGLDHSRFSKLLTCAGKGLAALIFIGYASIPLACWFGVLELTGNLS